MTFEALDDHVKHGASRDLLKAVPAIFEGRGFLERR
jgi:hypothetical protein